MRISVVDASALGALVFGEPGGEGVAEELADSELAAPALLWFELANVCLKKLKAHPLLTERLRQAFGLSGRLPIRIVEVELPAVVELGRETGLTAYDASYLWVARHLGGTLVTLDKKLRAAADSLNAKVDTKQ